MHKIVIFFLAISWGVEVAEGLGDFDGARVVASRCEGYVQASKSHLAPHNKPGDDWDSAGGGASLEFRVGAMDSDQEAAMEAQSAYPS